MNIYKIIKTHYYKKGLYQIIQTIKEKLHEVSVQIVRDEKRRQPCPSFPSVITYKFRL